MWPRRPSLPCLPPDLSNASAHSPHPGHTHTYADAHGSLSLAQKFWTCKHLRGPWTHPCSACCILPGPSPASFIRPLLAIPLSQSQSCFFQKMFTFPSPLCWVRSPYLLHPLVASSVSVSAKVMISVFGPFLAGCLSVPLDHRLPESWAPACYFLGFIRRPGAAP